MDDNDIELVVANRSFLFSLLARGFAEEPDQAFLNILVDGHTRQELGLIESAQTPDILSRYEEVRQWACRADAKEAAAHEYVRVFVGPGQLKARPWETVFLSGSTALFQKEVLPIREAYRTAGFLPVRYQQVPDDFIGIEFDFLNKMAQRAVEALQMGDQQLLARTLRQSEDFERRHLCTWVDAFADAVDLAYEPGFYGPFCHLAALVAQRDCAVVEALVGKYLFTCGAISAIHSRFSVSHR